MTTPVPGATISEDGNYWWDGSVWQLVDQNAQSSGGAAATAATAAPDGAPMPNAQEPYHPSTHGAYDPARHGEFDPAVHGPYHPQTHGEYDPARHGQYDRQRHGDFHPTIHGGFDPNQHGTYDPDHHGPFHPEIHGDFQQHTHGKFDPNTHGAYHPQIHGEFHQDRHGPHQPEVHGVHDPQMHGELSAERHGHTAVQAAHVASVASVDWSRMLTLHALFTVRQADLFCEQLQLNPTVAAQHAHDYYPMLDVLINNISGSTGGSTEHLGHAEILDLLLGNTVDSLDFPALLRRIGESLRATEAHEAEAFVRASDQAEQEMREVAETISGAGAGRH